MMLSGSRPLLAFFLINQNGVKCFFFHAFTSMYYFNFMGHLLNSI